VIIRYLHFQHSGAQQPQGVLTNSIHRVIGLVVKFSVAIGIGHDPVPKEELSGVIKSTFNDNAGTFIWDFQLPPE
jgi:hypothetical protein